MLIIKILLSSLLIAIVLIFTFEDREPSLGEKRCDELVAIQETAWHTLKTSVRDVGWDKSIPEIKDWNEKQINARKYCIGSNNHLYSGITTLNKRVNEFGNAGGFKVNY